jgi:hypothetical protein
LEKALLQKTWNDNLRKKAQCKAQRKNKKEELKTSLSNKVEIASKIFKISLPYFKTL